jgi:hypothetical protein
MKMKIWFSKFAYTFTCTVFHFELLNIEKFFSLTPSSAGHRFDVKFWLKICYLVSGTIYAEDSRDEWQQHATWLQIGFTFLKTYFNILEWFPKIPLSILRKSFQWQASWHGHSSTGEKFSTRQRPLRSCASCELSIIQWTSFYWKSLSISTNASAYHITPS